MVVVVAVVVAVVVVATVAAVAVAIVAVAVYRSHPVAPSPVLSSSRRLHWTGGVHVTAPMRQE